MTDYSTMSRGQLEARLKLAEDVCVLFGWAGPVAGTERGDALTQLWMTWARMTGVATGPDEHPDLDAMIPQLAAQRRAVRERTLATLWD